MTPLTAQQSLDAYFLEARSRLLDVAAMLDRIDRGGGADADPRVERLRRGLELILAGGNRAEEVQRLFSLPYDADWPRPQPRDVT